jgi:hypothetical protein
MTKTYLEAQKKNSKRNLNSVLLKQYSTSWLFEKVLIIFVLHYESLALKDF